MKKIKKIYGEIYDAKELLHDCFAWPILMTVTLVFINVVFFAFLSVVKNQRNIGETSLKEFLTMKYLTYTLIGRTILLIFATENMGNKMKLTGLILANLRDNSKDVEERQEVGLLKLSI